ncbi:MAG TPA: hypothetical protein VGH40_09690 [Roseiarcus sp.]|jgi:hypothetical protein
MAIKSSIFGRVTLTAGDAKKFEHQVKHGKPKTEAVNGLKRGVELSRSLREPGGKVTLTLKKSG